jgi:hypothetical protein
MASTSGIGRRKVAPLVHRRGAEELMMKRPVLSAAAVAFLSVGAAGAQEQPSGHADPAIATSSAIMLTGCIAKAPDGKGFILTQQAGAPGGVTSPQTGSAPGASATGDAPSGSVTAGTPTGTTATETAVPTPPVGEPGTAVNPSSPTFNQGQGAASTTGTVGRVDTAGAAIASASYRLRAPKGLDLTAHVGHTVQVRGVLAPDPRAKSGSSSSAVQADNPPVFTVETLTHRAATCTR